MPIKPENRARYPKNWKEIRQAILNRAYNRCEFCGVQNGVWRTKPMWGRKGFVYIHKHKAAEAAAKGQELTKIVLTIAHLDHQPENNDPANLRALCQKCHNDYDREHRQRNAAITRQQKRNGGACLELEVQ